MAEEYKPINCSFYDYFEQFATLRTRVKVVVIEDDKEEHIETLIHDLKTSNKEEFVLIDGDRWIRLDKVKSISKA